MKKIRNAVTKKEAFIKEYAKAKVRNALDGVERKINGAEIARKVGYGSGNHVRACEVINSKNFESDVQKYVQRELEALKNVPIMTKEDILKRLGQIAAGCPVTGQDAPPSYENQLSAMDKISKIHGLFIDKSQVEYSGAVPVILKDDIGK